MPSVTLKGNALEVVGTEVAAGQAAPDFRLQTTDMADLSLSTYSGKTRIIAAVPSLDTPVCSTEMQRFNQEASKLENTVVICASTDLPFAQKRWCGENSAENIVAASDHREATFGEAYGCLIKGGPLDRCLSRSIFVIGPDDKIKHVEYVGEIADEPNYDAALKAAQS